MTTPVDALFGPEGETGARADRIAALKAAAAERILAQLLEQSPDPSETEIRYWLAGNLCRCTGYDKIVRAVQAAAADLRGGA